MKNKSKIDLKVNFENSIRKVYDWFNKKYINKFNKKPTLEFKNFITYGFLFQVLASFYYFIFFSQFNISYFLYFHPADSILLANETFTIFLVIIFLFSFLFSPLVVMKFKKKDNNKIRNKHILGGSVSVGIILVLFYFLIEKIIYNIPFSEIFILSACLLIALIVSPFIHKTALRFIFLFILLASVWKSAKYEANNIKNNNKPSFNIVDKQDRALLEENDSCKFFIRRTSSSIFLSDSCLNEIDVIPISEIKKINFKKGIFK